MEPLPASPKSYPLTPLSHIPWLHWIDRTNLPSIVIGIVLMLCFLPFYNFNTIYPELPLKGSGFPPVLALTLAFLLFLTRGAGNDLRLLIMAGKVDTSYLDSLGASKRFARIEMLLGLVIGVERTYSQVSFDQEGTLHLAGLLTPGSIAVCLSILGYSVLQIHLLAFCVRQVVTFRRVATQYQVDLRAPELNNILANPLIRFLAVGLTSISLLLVLYQIIPYASQQRRVLNAGNLALLVWLVFICISLIPLFAMKSRIATAKIMEISFIRQAIDGNLQNVHLSQFGKRLKEFSPGELMYYEDRIKAIWEWPIEAQIRRLIIFGLLPPLTWVLAAGVEIMFESMIASG
jgi:hypothetical protein